MNRIIKTILSNLDIILVVGFTSLFLAGVNLLVYHPRNNDPKYKGHMREPALSIAENMECVWSMTHQVCICQRFDELTGAGYMTSVTDHKCGMGEKPQ